VDLQSSHNERCIFRRVPAQAPTNHARRTALAVKDEPFTAFFTPHLKVSSLFHAASNARRGLLVRSGAFFHNAQRPIFTSWRIFDGDFVG